MKRLVLGVACVCAGLAGAANTWWVDDDAAAGGNGSEASPFQTIQAAISACLVDAGDASYVATVGDTDCNGIQRVYNDNKIDIG